jgi:hypothetical protein
MPCIGWMLQSGVCRASRRRLIVQAKPLIPMQGSQETFMFVRRSVQGILLLCLGSTLAGCGNPSGLDSVQVTPATQSLAVGQTSQFTAYGTFGNASRPTKQNITNTVTWSSATPSVATVSTTGMVTAVSAGTTTISAEATAFNGLVSSSATLTVTGAGGGGGGGTGGVLTSLTIIPGAISVGNLQDTGNFLAIGTFSAAPFVRDLTNSVTWLSSFPDVFPVNSNGSTANPGAPGGIVTAYGNGSATITAEATNPNDGTIQTATATFTCPLFLPNPPTTPGSCFPGSEAFALKGTITVYNEGLNTTDWQVTAPSATGTANVIHCGPGWIKNGGTDTVCEAAYPINFQYPNLPPNTIILEATGGAFGGWSYSCTPSDALGKPIPLSQVTQIGPNYCTVTFGPTGLLDPNGNPILNTNVTVGAIFN